MALMFLPMLEDEYTRMQEEARNDLDHVSKKKKSKGSEAEMVIDHGEPDEDILNIVRENSSVSNLSGSGATHARPIWGQSIVPPYGGSVKASPFGWGYLLAGIIKKTVRGVYLSYPRAWERLLRYET